MRNKTIQAGFHILALLSIMSFYVIYLNKDYPRVGHDYYYFIPRLLDTALHYRVNGLSIQWYTPSFGGGIPAYANPQNIQFSLPQALTSFMDPWKASVAAMLVYLTIGYLSMYSFLKTRLSFRWQTAILGSMFFLFNGFYIEHMAVGHLGYQPFPLLPLLLLALFSPTVPIVISGAVIAIILTILINQAGFYLLIIFFLSLLVVLPLLYIIVPKLIDIKRSVIIGVIALFLFILMAASKGTAVYAFMRFFPRLISDTITTSLEFTLKSLVTQFLGTMNMVPLFWALGRDINTIPTWLRIYSGNEYLLWETDISLSPIMLGILFTGILCQLRLFVKMRAHIKFIKILPFLFLLLGIWLVLEFMEGRGIFYPAIKSLPIISSLHVNARFASAFILPFAILSSFLFESLSSKWIQLQKTGPIFLLTLLTVLGALPYFAYTSDVERRNYDDHTSLLTYMKIQAGETFPVKTIADVRDSETFLKNASNTIFYEPIFGYLLQDFHREINYGPVNTITDGKYNMNDPTGFVFPEENGTRPFERISAQDEDKFDQFINRYQPAWELSTLQKITNMISLISTSVVLILLIGYFIVPLRNFFQKRLFSLTVRK